MTDVLLLGDKSIPLGPRTELPSFELTEETHLDCRVSTQSRTASVSIGGEFLPLEQVDDGWAVDRAWVDEKATSHLVGELSLLLELDTGSWHGRLLRRPSRITEIQFRWLLDELAGRAGIEGVTDPEGRAQVWSEFSPAIPSPEEERAAWSLWLWRRAGPAFKAVVTKPHVRLDEDWQWQPVGRLRPGQRVNSRRIRPWDPPRPLPSPREGQVLVAAPDEGIDTPENRFAVAVLRRLQDELRRAVDLPSRHSDIPSRALRACSEIDVLLPDVWKELPRGPRPQQSFVLRDNVAYRTVAAVGRQLDRLAGLLWTFPPLTPDAWSITPASLNYLFENWVGALVLDWLSARLGPCREDRPAVPTGGLFTWELGRGRVVRFRRDVPYPRRPGSHLYCPPTAVSGKNRPDVAVERWNGRIWSVVSLDATWSRSPLLHSEKMLYTRTISDGSRRQTTASSALCCANAAVAYPGEACEMDEQRGGLTEVVLSLPPGPEAVEVLNLWADLVLEDLISDALPGRRQGT